MPNTYGFHLAKTGFGLWLPGDQRGHWSEAYDEQIGLIEPRTLHAGDPVCERMARERMAEPPTRLSRDMIGAVASAVERCGAESDWAIAAISIEPTHMHLLLTYTPRPIDKTAKWIADQTTKAVHQDTCHTGKVWSKGRWLECIFDESHWLTLRRYIEHHNVRRGLPARPYRWIVK